MNIITNSDTKALDFNFAKEVSELSNQPINLCFQCQRCASGCQMSAYGDLTPNQIIRMIQFGLKDELLKSRAIWLCVNCDTCGARCPNNISISAITDTLREMALKEQVPAAVKNIPIFHNNFINSIKSWGRVHEISMLGFYKLKSGDLFSDLKMGFDLFTRGKLPLLPSRVRAKDQLRKIFNNIDKVDLHE